MQSDEQASLKDALMHGIATGQHRRKLVADFANREGPLIFAAII